MIDESLISDYQANRAAGVDRSVLCHAPFTSLNFDQHGSGRVCCYNVRARLGRWPAMTLAEMWTGAQAIALRQSFIQGSEAIGCDLCFDQLRARNFKGTLMHNFDQVSQVEGYRPTLQPHAPRVIELELSNTCNLECIQCQAKWSSLIRKNREHMAPLAMPYNEAFVDQLEPFLPHLAEARFLGGEPMLIRLYHQIWERIRAINPAIVLSITTNGTLIPDRVMSVLNDLRCHICLSIDSLDPANYARIRKHASLDVVLANFQRWRDYTRERGTGVSVAVCPMIHNWRDLPEFLNFSERYGVSVGFNTVVRPWVTSLASLTHHELDEVIAYLGVHQPPQGNPNAGTWASLIGQLGSWRDTRCALDSRFVGLVTRVRAAARSHATLLDRRDGDDRAELVADGVARLLASAWLGQNGPDGDLAGRLAQMTPPDDSEDALCAQQTVLLRVLVLLRNLGMLTSSEPAALVDIDAGRLSSELDLIARMVDSPEKLVDWPTMWDLFPDWDLLAEWLARHLNGARMQTSGS